jgi:hypothetical protein
MGQLEQFAKQTFAEETESVTDGGAVWLGSPEVNLSEVRLDGVIAVREPAKLGALAAPWSEAQRHEEIVVELKMAGDHLDVVALQRALLRRQARQVLRTEGIEPAWEGEEALWMVAPHLPSFLARLRTVERVAPGCYRVLPASFSFLWIASNELPLTAELVPFLVTRSGRALDELARWALISQPPAWLARMVEFLPMSLEGQRALIQFLSKDDPALREKQIFVARTWLENYPEITGKLIEEGRLIEARSNLRAALATRGLELSVEDEARIDGCSDLATLERWHQQAIRATSTVDALK